MNAVVRYAGGREALPKGMAGKEIHARYEAANQRKSHWTTHLQEAYRYAVPHRDTFYDDTPGQKKTRDVFDSTAVLGVPQFATRLQSVLVPPWRDFSSLVLGPDWPEEMRNDARIAAALAESTDILFSHVHHSNMATQVHEAFQDLAVGTGCYDVMSGAIGDKTLVFNAVPLAELVLEEGPQSTIETTYRCLKVAARNVTRTWAGAQLPVELERLARENGDSEQMFIEAVIYDPQRQLWQGAVVWKDKKEVIWRSEWQTNPRIVFRWSVMPGEIYGRGPILQVLADIKTANKVVEFILRNAAIAVAGMWTAVSDGALNPYNFRAVPGGVIPVMSNDQRNPTIRALERSGDLGLGFEVLRQLQENIKRALFENLREPAGPVRSATEIAIEDRELVNQIGSSFGRLQTEVVEATVQRCVDVLSRKGYMPPLRIDGRTITLKHQSPLARAQDMDDLMTLERTMAAIPQEVAPMAIKIEELGAWVAKKTGLDPRLVRSEQERMQMQAQAAQLLAQTQGQAA